MKKLFLVVLTILLAAAAILSGCAQSANTSESTRSVIPYAVPAPAPAAPPVIGSAPAAGIAAGVYKDAGVSVTTSVSEERKIVRNGNISLIVKDVIDVRDKIAQIAISLGGYVLSSYMSGKDEGLRGAISVRVPDDKFENAMSQFRALAVRVVVENTSSQDVTQEYIDLKVRLGNAQATEKQYLTLLEKATSVEDILKIYDSLSRVRSEIEQLKGRIQYLDQTTSTSLISVNLEPETSAKALAPAGWNAPEILKSAVRGLVTLAQWLGTLAIWILIFIPVWGIILGIIIWRRRRKKLNIVK